MPNRTPENDTEYLGLPNHLRDGFRSYIEGNHQAGGFIMACLRNDLMVACARADGVINESYGLDEAIRRIKAFANAGADLLYVPLVPDRESLQTVVASVTKPVNALAAGALTELTVAQLAAIGVRRISVGVQIARLTHAAIRDATRAMLTEGSFAAFASGASGNEIDAMLAKGADGPP